jgi:hypothetical protein
MLEKLTKDGDRWFDDHETYWDSPKDYLQTEILGFCGCGDPDELMEYVRKLLVKLYNQEWGEYEDLPYMFFVSWANDKEFADHGVSVRCSWLTDIGRELLADIEKVTVHA